MIIRSDNNRYYQDKHEGAKRLIHYFLRILILSLYAIKPESQAAAAKIAPIRPGRRTFPGHAIIRRASPACRYSAYL